MIGKTISHYKILEKLGEGGMGVVYKARDTKLDRLVALKFFPHHLIASETERARFLQEAKAAAQLNHPNICMIYGIEEYNDEQFIVMEFVDGKTLRTHISNPKSRIPFDQIVDWGLQIGGALSAAHEKQITHRDIKPDNIMVNTKNQIKVMDFGLAKFKDELGLTKTATTVGTIAYMSPEQIRAEKVDHRTDIWAFGVVLFEMLAGRLPFRGEHQAAMMYSITNEEPQPFEKFRPDIPHYLQTIVRKALQKENINRYQTIQELLVDIKERSSTVSIPKQEKSIAVLPFDNMSPEKENEYFSDGISEEIINALAKVSSLRVAARTSSFAFKGKNVDIKTIAQALQVNSVLEGSVRKAGKRVRITAQLINVVDGYHLWSERYDRDLDDVFAIQDEISLAIVDALKTKLFGGEHEALVKRHTENLEAYELYLKGRYSFYKRTVEDLKTSIRYFEQGNGSGPRLCFAI